MQTLHTPSRSGRSRREALGFSLVELIVAFAIFLVASLAAYALYVAGTNSFKKAENATDVQQTTRSAFDRMIRELRLAGFNHNADGAPARPDEQIEAAYDTAITFRADFDADDPIARVNPETSLKGIYNIVTTGNDEIVTYALGKPTLPSGSALSFTADVVEAARDGDQEAVLLPGVVAVQNDPPYTLYRISLRNIAAMGGFDGTFDGLPEFTVEPIADNVRWLRFRYFDNSGNLLNPATFDDPSDDVGGAESNRNQRLNIARVEVEMEGMTPDPDPHWVDPGDSDPDTQQHRKFNLEAAVTPRNLGRKGIPDLDLQPPSTPTGLSACVGHCGGVLLSWSPNPANQLVTQYKVAFGTTTGNLNQFRSTGETWAYIDGLSPTGTHYFAVAAADGAGNQSPFSAEITAVNVNNTVPGEVPGFAAAASTAQPGIIVTWDPLAVNDSSVTGASGSAGCDFQKPINRDLGGYALFRDSGSDPSTGPGDELVGPASLNRNAIQHLDTSVIACRDYTYDIRAEDSCGVSGADQAATVTSAYTTNVAPAAPTNVNAAESGTNKNTVVWDDVLNDVNGNAIAVAGYKVHRAEAPAGLPPSDPSLYGFIGSSPTTSYVDNYGGDGAPSPGNIFWYRVSAVDACPNESALSSPDGAECAFDGGIDITPAAGTTVYGIVPIQITPTGSDTYVGAALEIRDSSGNVVFGPVTSSTQPYTFSWDTRSTYPDTYLIIGKVVNAAGCAQAAFSRVRTITTPACCLSQTGQDLVSDNRANSNIVVRLLANLCDNDITATGMVVTFNMADSRTQLDDIRWNGASVISGNNYPSPSTFVISVFIPSVFNGGGEQEVVFDFDRPLSVGDGVSFDLTYGGAVVGTQTCTFNAVISNSSTVTATPIN